MKSNLNTLVTDLKLHRSYTSESNATDDQIVRAMNAAQMEIANAMYSTNPNEFGYYIDYSAAGSGTLPPLLKKIQYVQWRSSSTSAWSTVNKIDISETDGMSDTDSTPTTGTFRVYYARMLPALSYGAAAAGSATTVTLQASPTIGETSVEDDYYNGATLENITNGETGIITDYVGSTKVATVTLTTATDASDIYNIVCDLPTDFMYDGLINGALKRLTRDEMAIRDYYTLLRDVRSLSRKEEQSYGSLSEWEVSPGTGRVWYRRANTIYFRVG